MAVVDARANLQTDGSSDARGRAGGHVRRRITSGSARWAVATQSLMMLACVGLFVFFLLQDLEPPYSIALLGLLGVLAATRLLAVANLSFTFGDAGLEIYTSVQHHWLAWGDVSAISEVEIRRQNILSMLLGGARPFRVLRVHRRLRPPITVRASRGIEIADLAVMRTIAERNGTEWLVSDEFAALAVERGVWARR